MTIKIAVLGAGSWGTALASHLSGNGHTVDLWGRSADVVRSVNTRHENTRYLPGIRLHAALNALCGGEGKDNSG